MTAIVILAHALPSMVPVIEQAIAAGHEVSFIGKAYSTIPSAVDAMRAAGAIVHTPDFGEPGQLVQEARAFVRELDIGPDVRLFDSGGVLRSVYGRGNQLTTHCASSSNDVGLNRLKRLVEAPHIARAVLSQIPHTGRRVMVVGDGVIGSALKAQLMQTVSVEPDIIIGATGSDISAQILPFCQRPVELYSASSWDVEFNALLTDCPPNVFIGNRGCPMNFNRQAELEPAYCMRETRAALLAAILDGAA